jgi:type II secretory pathway pseudopilin PulG
MSLAVLALLVGLSGCGKPGGTNGGKPDAALTARLEAIRQAGQPVTLAELNAWYPEPPAGENAAPLYAEAFAALAVADAKSPSFLTKNQPALALLHKAATKSQCRYPIDVSEGVSLPLPHLAKIKTCAQLLSKETMANAAKGRVDLAAQDVMDGLRLAGSLEQEPVQISQLVRISSDTLTQSGLEGALGLKSFTEEQLVRLQAALAQEESTIGPSLTRSFAAVRCMVISLFQMPLPEYEKLAGSAGTNCPIGAPAEFERYRKGAVGRADFNLCLDYFSNWLAVASAPLPASLEAAGQWVPGAEALVSDAKAKGYRVSAAMLPSLNSTMDKAADCVGQLRAAQAALAVERYRLGTGSALPDSLGQLVPKYLAAVPDDPYDGKPLRYKKPTSKGYLVYSIGRNRVDDGGVPKPMPGNADGPYDLTFAVRR